MNKPESHERCPAMHTTCDCFRAFSHRKSLSPEVNRGLVALPCRHPVSYRQGAKKSEIERDRQLARPSIYF